MVKLAVFVVAALALQGVFAGVTKYDEDFKFVDVWDQIQSEIKEVTLHLRNSNTEDREYIKTVTYQCQKLAKLVEDVISSLREEDIGHEQGDIIFKRVMYVFQQVHNSLKHIALFHDNVDVLEIRNRFIYNLEAVCEHMQQLVFIGKTYCPQLRAVLRTLLDEFLECVRGFRKNVGILEQNIIIYESPKRMVTQIKELTQQFTDLLKECNHIEEIRMVLRGYTRYVEEIVQKLESKVTLDNKEVDVVMQRLTDKLRKVLVPLMRLVTREELIDVKVFRTEIIAHFFEINSIFEQLIQSVDIDKCPTEVKNFLESIIYYYYYAIKQTHFEIRTAYKSSFYGRDYHNEFFYGKHGYEFYGENLGKNLRYERIPVNKYENFPFIYSERPRLNKMYKSEERIYTPYHYGKYEKTPSFYSERPWLNKMYTPEERMYTPYEKTPLFYSEKSWLNKMYKPEERMYTPYEKTPVSYSEKPWLNKMYATEERMYTPYEMAPASYSEKPWLNKMYAAEERIYTPYEKSPVSYSEKPWLNRMYATEERMYNPYEMINKYEKIPFYYTEKPWLNKKMYSENFNEKYTKENKMEIETPKEMVIQIQRIVRQICENLQYTTEDVQMKPMTVFYLREFVKVLENVIDKIEKEIKVERLMYTETVMRTFCKNLKEMKIEIENMLNSEEFNIHKMRLTFAHLIQWISTELYKIVLVEKMQDSGFEHVLIKDICIEFYTFFRNIYYKMNVYNQEFFPSKYSSDDVEPIKGHKLVLIKIIKY